MWRIPLNILDTGDDATAINHVLNQLLDPNDFFQRFWNCTKIPLSSVLMF